MDWVNDIKLTWQILPSIIRYYPESGRICYPKLSGIRYPVEFDIRVYPKSGKKVYPVHP